SQPECFLLVEVVAKCMILIYIKRYETFFEANGSLIGMQRYLDEIKEEDLRSFIVSNANSENGGILMPTVEDVLKVVNKFDEDDMRHFFLQEWEQDYLYKFQYPFEEESQQVGSNLKISESPVYLDVEFEKGVIKILLRNLDITSKQTAKRARKKCSFCGEKCFKYLMCQAGTASLIVEEEFED
ncbi:hypothetical protein CDAR_595971, partial [Caerostris darwini]